MGAQRYLKAAQVVSLWRRADDLLLFGDDVQVANAIYRQFEALRRLDSGKDQFDTRQFSNGSSDGRVVW